MQLNKTDKNLGFLSYLLLGASTECSSCGTTFTCKYKFLGNPSTLYVDVKPCQKPVVVNIRLGSSKVFDERRINRVQIIHLYDHVFLIVIVEVNDGGDKSIKVCFD